LTSSCAGSDNSETRNSRISSTRTVIPQFAVLCGVILAHAQPATASGVIRSTTRLVEISVVVLDKKSNQVTGLTRGDFQMLDEGVQRNISFFTGAGVAPAAAGRAPATTGQSGATPAPSRFRTARGCRPVRTP
jgi:hypothetical protein